MWMANLFVVLIILGCAAYLYLKGTLVKSLAMVITAVCASIVAFSYYEILANVLIGRSDNTAYSSLASWAQPLSFILLFILAFAILQTLVMQVVRRPIDLGLLPERVGSIICGMFLGLIISGLLLTALAMAPLPNEYPYPRFDSSRPDAENPSKVLFSPDGFVTGWFSMISRGSFSGKRSFAVLHPALPDQAFLNRHKKGVSIVTGDTQAIKVPGKRAAWIIAGGLKNSEDPNELIEPRRGHNLTVVRVGMNKRAARKAGVFTLSQLRLICKHKSYAENPLSGNGINVCPVGYLKTANQVQIKPLNEEIRFIPADFKGSKRWIDFVFKVPNDFLPVWVEFKQNNIAEVPPLIPADQAPPPQLITHPPEGQKDNADEDENESRNDAES